MVNVCRCKHGVKLMAEIVGCIAMSHSPQLLTPPDRWDTLPDRTKGPFKPKPGIAAELTPEQKHAKADRCNKAISVLRDQLAAFRSDTVVIFGDDQEENILFDNMPAFTIFIGEEADATLRFRYFGEKATDQMTRYKVNRPLAMEILHGCMDRGFDPAWSKETRYEAGLGHAFGRVLKYLMPSPAPRIVPIMVNTYYPPAPSAKRCFDFGVAVGNALRASDDPGRIVLIASGGLSHTKIDETFDRAFLEAITERDTSFLQNVPPEILRGGTSEVLNWIAVAGAVSLRGRMVDYVPAYRNEHGVGCAMGFAVWDT